MARKGVRCNACNDTIWFRDVDIPEQSVTCVCGGTRLSETGAVGDHTVLTAEELDILE
jgi:hypothetical protein